MSNLPQISEAEFEVMKIVWKYAPISTNEITEKLTQISSWSPKTPMRNKAGFLSILHWSRKTNIFGRKVTLF